MSAENINSTEDKYNKNVGSRRSNNFGPQRRNNGERPSNGNVPQGSNNVGQQRQYAPQYRRNNGPAGLKNTENKREHQTSNETNQGNSDIPQQHRQNNGQYRGYHRRQNYAPKNGNNFSPEEGDANVRPYRHNNYNQRRNYGQQRRGNGRNFVQNNTDAAPITPMTIPDVELPAEEIIAEPQQVQVESVVKPSYRNALLGKITAAKVKETKAVTEVAEIRSNIATEQANIDISALQINEVAQQDESVVSLPVVEPRVVNEVSESQSNIASEQANISTLQISEVAQHDNSVVPQVNFDQSQLTHVEPQSCNSPPPQIFNSVLLSPSCNVVPLVDNFEPKAQNFFQTPKGRFHIIGFIKLDKYGQEFIVPSCFNLGWNSADEKYILLDRVKKQLEFYLSEENLSTDAFMRNLINGQGWVQINEIMPFRRLQGLTKDFNVILEAVLSSQKLEVSDDKSMIRRRILSN